MQLDLKGFNIEFYGNLSPKEFQELERICTCSLLKRRLIFILQLDMLRGSIEEKVQEPVV
jgi:hypothetical protein